MSGYDPDEEKPSVNRVISTIAAQPSYPIRQSSSDEGWGSKIFLIGIIIGLFAIAGIVGAKSLTVSTPQPICNAPAVNLSCPTPIIYMNNTVEAHNSTTVCNPTFVCAQGNATVVNQTRNYSNSTLHLYINGTLNFNATLAFSENMTASVSINDTIYNFTVLVA